MTRIKLDEISLVDYPAHTVNGFAIVKSESNSDTDAILSALGNRTEMPTPQELLAKALADVSADDILKALEGHEAVEEITKALGASEESAEQDIYKGLPEQAVTLLKAREAEIAKMREEREEARAEAEIAKAARLDGEAIEKSKADYTNLAFNHEKVAPAIRKFAALDAEAAEEITTMLKAVNAQADGAIFDELGTSTKPVEKAIDGIESIAKAMVEAGTAANLPEAIAKAVADPANKSLVDAYFKAGN